MPGVTATSKLQTGVLNSSVLNSWLTLPPLEPSELREDYDSTTGYLRVDVPLKPAGVDAAEGTPARGSILLKLTRKIFRQRGAEAKD